jgi:tRNA pseudouridine38-40 synthase
LVRSQSNIRVTIQYDGTNFNGYELQPGKRTVRAELEGALHKLFQEKTKLISASRTDAGVHALGQVVNFSLKNNIQTDKIVPALNSVLPADIRVIMAEAVSPEFNSRFGAKKKEYEYLIYNGQACPPHLRGIVWLIKPKLDLGAMRQAAKLLVGKQDFASFCAAHSDDTDFVRTLYKVEVRQKPIVIWNGCQLSVVSCKFVGNGFLYKMVRNMVGTLVEAGLGQIKAADVKSILEAKDRKLAGRTAPAQGLCLVKINY